MGTATFGGKGLKERTRVSGERPMGAASFSQQSIQASCTGGAPGQDPTPKGGGGGPPPPLYGPQNCRTEQGALSAPEAPEILF